MISTKRRQDRVAKGQLSLREVAPDKIALFRRELVVAQKFLREQPAGAAIEQESGGFGQRNPARIEMMFAAAEDRFRGRVPIFHSRTSNHRALRRPVIGRWMFDV